LILYYGYVLLLRWKGNIRFVIILHPPQPDWNIVMSAYYQVVLPIGLLGLLGKVYPWLYLMIPIYGLLFPNEILRNFAFVKRLLNSKMIRW
jgi:hypothetical protein